MNELLATLKEIRAAADVIGDSPYSETYIATLYDIYLMADAAVVSAETSNQARKVKP